MRILCIGGGPAGLYSALLLKQADPANAVRVVERNRPDDTFGWGVVFSDHTLGNLEAADPASAHAILGAFNHWDDIDVHFKGRTITSGGHGFCGIGREAPAQDPAGALRRSSASSSSSRPTSPTTARVRRVSTPTSSSRATASTAASASATCATLRSPTSTSGDCRFVWLGTKKLLRGVHLRVRGDEWGWFQAHAYRYDGDTSTFIVETPEEVWQKAGLERMDAAGGRSPSARGCSRKLPRRRRADEQRAPPARIGDLDPVSAHRLRQLGALGERDGKPVPVVLMGDAAHTAHFSVGSGTKLALEDAIALARALRGAGRPATRRSRRTRASARSKC